MWISMTNKCCFYLLIIVVSDSVQTVNSFAEADDDIYETDYQNCVCVPYWQCKEDYSGLIEDGIDIIDIRYPFFL